MTMEGTSWLAFVLTITMLLVLVCFSVSHYGNFRKQPWYVSVACILGWFFPFWIVLLLPMDMASMLYDKCEGGCREPLTHVSATTLYVAWRTIYWTSFCLTWFTIPMMQAYVNTGEFNVVSKLRTALRVNLKFYSIYVVVGLIGLVYLVFKGGYTTWAKLQSFVMAMANSWGLFLVIMFMGYGCVAVPRELWFSGMLKHRLDELCKKAPRAKEECMDSELEYDELAKTINTISHRPLRHDPHLHRLVDQTVARFPFARNPTYADPDHTLPVPSLITEEYLVDVNRRMIWAERNKERKSALWNNLLHEAFYLQDIETNRSNSDRRFRSSLRPSVEGTFWSNMLLRAEWWWVIVFRSRVYRALAVFAAIFSVCMLWSELTFNIQSPLVSIVGLTVRAYSQEYNYAGVEIVSFFILAWMCISVYTSLFKVRFFNLYLLIPHHHTDPNSLLWFTSYMCKMMAPLCYNYINLLGSANGGEDDTVFSKFMGKANLVPFLGNVFIDWFPVVILIPALAAFFQSHWFGMSSTDGDEEHGDLNVDVAEGLQLIVQERQQIERSMLQYHEPPSGILGRVRSAFGIYTSKYTVEPARDTRRDGRGAAAGLDGAFLGARSSHSRQERDQRLDAILRGQQAPTTQTPSPNEQVPLNKFNWQAIGTLGETAKGRIEQLFSNKDDDASRTPQSSIPPYEPPQHTVLHQPTPQHASSRWPLSSPPSPPPSIGGTTVNSAPSSRATSPPPQPGARPSSGRVLGRIPPNAPANAPNGTSRVSPFARFGDSSSS